MILQWLLLLLVRMLRQGKRRIRSAGATTRSSPNSSTSCSLAFQHKRVCQHRVPVTIVVGRRGEGLKHMETQKETETRIERRLCYSPTPTSSSRSSSAGERWWTAVAGKNHPRHFLEWIILFI